MENIMFYSNAIKTAALLTTLGIGLLLPTVVEAHCDTVNGPVAVAAREALATEDVDKVLIWVTDQQEAELEAAYRQALKVYKQGGASKELAERYFMENAVRLHRLAEGMSYTGLKPARPHPEAIQKAEKALELGELNPATDLLITDMRKKASHLFKEAMEARAHKDESVAAGRRWVNAYVKYAIYIEGLHHTIQAGPAHGVGE